MGRKIYHPISPEVKEKKVRHAQTHLDRAIRDEEESR